LFRGGYPDDPFLAHRRRVVLVSVVVHDDDVAVLFFSMSAL